jgi:hypothetical protein
MENILQRSEAVQPELVHNVKSVRQVTKLPHDRFSFKRRSGLLHALLTPLFTCERKDPN